MRAVVQRVREASVRVQGEVVGQIRHGLLVFLGIRKGDGEHDIRYLADKILDLRVFEEGARRMHLSVQQVGGEILVISQFTLYGDCRRGRRPSFDSAEDPERAERLYRELLEYLRQRGCAPKEGVFGALMDVQLVNDGPVTLLLDSTRAF